jgi:hypothetical protein
MTYPQPNTNAQTTSGGASQWRLYTKVAQAGEIYEIDSPSSAIAMGPDSDFANVLITYLDTSLDATGDVGSIHVSPQYPFGGNIAPRFDTNYPLSTGTPPRAGRMLVSLLDNFNTLYAPTGFNPATDTIYRVPPYLDLIGWQKYPPPTLPSRRSDRDYLFQNHPAANAGGAAGQFVYMVPTFGRKYIFVDFFNLSGANINFGILGVRFVQNGTATGGPGFNIEKILLASAGVANNAGAEKIIPASTLGMFDAIIITLGTATGVAIAQAPIRVTMSDDPI